MSDIQPGAYVRAVRGMYSATTGRVVKLHESADGPYATIDMGEAQYIGVLLSALELVGAVPTAEQERDAAIAERDRLRFDVQQLRDRVRRGEDIRPEQMAEMLGDMLDGCES